MAKSIVVRLAARRYCAGCSATRNGWPAEPGGAELQQAVLAQRRTALATIAKRLASLGQRVEARRDSFVCLCSFVPLYS